MMKIAIFHERGFLKLGRTLIGISSWGDSSLIKSGFYPAERKASEDRLQYYASKFPVVESDASYHVIPSGQMIQSWIQATPGDFVFDLKVFSLFSGHPTPLTSIPRDLREEAKKALKKGDHLYINHLDEVIEDKMWERFRSAIFPLREAGKLGFVMIQYPPWFHPTVENLEYIAKCKTKLEPFKVAVEFRTADWFAPSHVEQTLNLLRSLEITLVCVDEPQGLKTSIPPIGEVTSQFGVIRFHGRNAREWEEKHDALNMKYDYLYTKAEMEEWMPKIRRLQDKTGELHLIFKNKHLDHPVVNALEMKDLLGL
jgi:uncharacterized protein YecE (DUF72 family)